MGGEDKVRSLSERGPKRSAETSQAISGDLHNG